MDEAHKKKISDAHKAKGELHWSKRPEVRAKMSLAKLGKKRKPFTKETLLKMGKAKKGVFLGDKSPLWKGDNIAYDTLHQWKKKSHGSPLKCESCGIKGRYDEESNGKKYWTIEWSNKSESYKRDLNDWEGLCVPCHRKKDMERRRLKGKVT